MRSQASPRFWQLFQNLPAEVQRLAVKNYRLWQTNRIIRLYDTGGWKVAMTYLPYESAIITVPSASSSLVS